MEIIKAVIPAAGRGERFLPFTKAIPKEMIPLGTKPAIHYIIDEALQSHVTNICLITSKQKQSIADYFDRSDILDIFLHEQNKEYLVAEIKKIMRLAHLSYIRQAEPLGLGHAVLMAQHIIGKEYFSIMLPDDIITHKTPALTQLMRIARQEKASVIAVQEVPRDLLSSYGVISIKKQITPNLFQISSVVEKPNPKDAPSSLAVVGRYILSHKIFASIEAISDQSTHEIQLSDAITHMIQNNEKVFAYKVQGMRYDIGTPAGWTKAIIGFALTDPDLGPTIRKFIQEIDTTESYLYNPAKAIEHMV